jgi:hypothetical protein
MNCGATTDTARQPQRHVQPQLKAHRNFVSNSRRDARRIVQDSLVHCFGCLLECSESLYTFAKLLQHLDTRGRDHGHPLCHSRQSRYVWSRHSHWLLSSVVFCDLGFQRSTVRDQFLAFSNSLFIAATFVALIIQTARDTLDPIDIYIVSLLMFGFNFYLVPLFLYRAVIGCSSGLGSE